MKHNNIIIGKKNQFAIQYSIEQTKKPYIWGHICYWIQGMMIGDITHTTILSDVFVFLPRIVHDNGNRFHELFYKMNKDKACYFLSGQAFVDNPKYEEQAIAETWARFSIEIGLDVFSGTIVKLIENESEARIIYSFDGKKVYDLFLKKGIVDDVFEQFLEQFNCISRNFN